MKNVKMFLTTFFCMMPLFAHADGSDAQWVEKYTGINAKCADAILKDAQTVCNQDEQKEAHGNSDWHSCVLESIEPGKDNRTMTFTYVVTDDTYLTYQAQLVAPESAGIAQCQDQITRK